MKLIFIVSIIPFLSCVFKGSYRLKKGELDISAFLLFPADRFYWKVRGEMLDGRTNNLIMCVLVEAKVDFKRRNQLGNW